MTEADVRLEPWGPGDEPLLARLVGDPAMMEHLGGPESPEKIADRQQRYALPGSDQYRIVCDGEAVGWVGFFERTGVEDWEIGWSVVPDWQARGVATRATAALLELMRMGPHERHRWVHAFPSVDNEPSNRLCRRLGFELLGSSGFEYPVGQWMECNDWRLDLLEKPAVS
jgi:RimJ/RimL family protein N-acetyltransferase